MALQQINNVLSGLWSSGLANDLMNNVGPAVAGDVVVARTRGCLRRVRSPALDRAVEFVTTARRSFPWSLPPAALSQKNQYLLTIING